MNLAIDIDEVIYPFVDHFRKFLSDFKWHEHPMPVPTQWDFAEEWGLAKAEFLEFFHEFERAQFHSFPNPVTNAVEVLAALRAKDHTITLVTARGTVRDTTPQQRAAVQSSTIQWINDRGVPYDGIVFTDKKTTVNAQIFLDDAEHHLEAISKTDALPVCFMRGHNQNWKGLRVADWCEFYDLVEERGKFLERRLESK